MQRNYISWVGGASTVGATPPSVGRWPPRCTLMLIPFLNQTLHCRSVSIIYRSARSAALTSSLSVGAISLSVCRSVGIQVSTPDHANSVFFRLYTLGSVYDRSALWTLSALIATVGWIELRKYRDIGTAATLIIRSRGNRRVLKQCFPRCPMFIEVG